MIPRLHLVTDDAVLAQSNFISTATRLLRALDRRIALHIRARSVSAHKLFEIAAELTPHGGMLVINDRADIAITAVVDAVQLGARSLPVASVRALSSRLTIGYSAHGAAEAAAAQRDGADFVFAGSIYETASHPGVTPAGMALLRDSVAACRIPVMAIGGVTQGRVGEILSSGAHGVAVISAVWHVEDPVQTAEQFAKLLEV